MENYDYNFDDKIDMMLTNETTFNWENSFFSEDTE